MLSFLLLCSMLSCSKNDDSENQATDCDDVDFSMTTAKWRMYSIYDDYKQPAPNVFEQTAEGLTAYNLTYRGGSMIITNKEYDLAGKTAYFKWKANGMENFSGIVAFISNECYDDPFVTRKEMAFLSTKQPYNQYVKINDNTIYYTRVLYSASGATGITASNNYDDQGGSIIQNISVTNVNPIGRFGMYIGDGYSIGASLTLMECKIR